MSKLRQTTPSDVADGSSRDLPEFELKRFLPYLLNQSAEATGKGFQAIYAVEHGLSRTEWRIVANLGRFGSMTAAEIGRISHIEKSKVSRAVARLGEAGLIVRCRDEGDRRLERLALTDRGHELFLALGRRALDFDRELRDALGADLAGRLEEALNKLIAIGYPAIEDGEE